MTTRPNHSDDEIDEILDLAAKADRYVEERDQIRAEAKAAIQAYVQQEVVRGWRRVDLNDPKYMLQFIDDPIEKFNMFIKKWCPDYAHLIDSDDNDGEEIRQMIAALKAEGADHD